MEQIWSLSRKPGKNIISKIIFKMYSLQSYPSFVNTKDQKVNFLTSGTFHKFILKIVRNQKKTLKVKKVCLNIQTSLLSCVYPSTYAVCIRHYYPYNSERRMQQKSPTGKKKNRLLGNDKQPETKEGRA